VLSITNAARGLPILINCKLSKGPTGCIIIRQLFNFSLGTVVFNMQPLLSITVQLRLQDGGILENASEVYLLALQAQRGPADVIGACSRADHTAPHDLQRQYLC
jgi:hypothetical protein